jgi:transketolase
MTESEYLRKKAKEIRKETLLIHKRAPETRVASSLSPIEVFVALYYGKVLNFDPKNPLWEGRDRFVISKGHGSISMYPILADLGFFDKSELEKVCRPGSFLGGIPDPIIPGYETINGSLGHGMGVGCGMAVALKAKNSDSSVFVIVGDGELNDTDKARWVPINEALDMSPQLFDDHHAIIETMVNHLNTEKADKRKD